MTREEWAKRPLAERLRAFTSECERKYGISPHPTDFGIDPDLLDTPNDRVGPMPWRLQIAARILPIFSGRGGMTDSVGAAIHYADALLAAAQEKP